MCYIGSGRSALVVLSRAIVYSYLIESFDYFEFFCDVLKVITFKSVHQKAAKVYDIW